MPKTEAEMREAMQVCLGPFPHTLSQAYSKSSITTVNVEVSHSTSSFGVAQGVIDMWLEVESKEHAMPRDLVDLLRRIFVYDPRDRISAREMLQHSFFASLKPTNRVQRDILKTIRDKWQ